MKIKNTSGTTDFRVTSEPIGTTDYRVKKPNGTTYVRIGLDHKPKKRPVTIKESRKANPLKEQQ